MSDPWAASVHPGFATAGFDAAAVRWAGRLALERKGLKLVELSDGVRALDKLPDPPARRLLLAVADPRRQGPPP